MPCLAQRRGSERTCSSRCTLSPAARTARSAYSRLAARYAICSGTRYAKWARGSCSQTHRRAAMCGFTQDDGYVRGVAPTQNPPSTLSSLFGTRKSTARGFTLSVDLSLAELRQECKFVPGYNCHPLLSLSRTLPYSFRTPTAGLSIYNSDP